jgi:alkaline phosphatase
MKRRNFFKGASLATVGTLVAPQILGAGCTSNAEPILKQEPNKRAKNIIFLVSDGMSIGTLNMADLLARTKLGRQSNWISAYHNNTIKRALMDTASANSLVTDSAAACSAWGGGHRVSNGRLNVGDNDEMHTPILQKFKKHGKSVGCVTSVPITHATPAGFCIINKSRGNQSEIAEDYLDLEFDVMLGGGLEYFDAEHRADGKDMFSAFAQAGYGVAKTKDELEALRGIDKPIMGVFHESGIPYDLDHTSDNELSKSVPSLVDMTQFAIDKMSKNDEGFVLQIEGGKVDWAAHGNDIGGLLYDQLAFDECVKLALDFAEKRDDTLVIITTDHGNANPGLFYGKEADKNFAKISDFKHTNRWVLTGLQKKSSVNEIIERINFAQGITLSQKEAKTIYDHFQALPGSDADNNYNDYSLPFKKLADIQTNHLNVGWAGMHHSGDYVELAMTGPGADSLPQFVKNYELHNFMLVAAGVDELVK